jgi:hypothetical protein
VSPMMIVSRQEENTTDQTNENTTTNLNERRGSLLERERKTIDKIDHGAKSPSSLQDK